MRGTRKVGIVPAGECNCSGQETGDLEDVGLNGRITLKWILSRLYTGFIWLRVGPWNPVVNHQAPSHYFLLAG